MKMTVIGFGTCFLIACAAGLAPKPFKGKTPKDGIRCFKVTQAFPFRDMDGRVIRYDTFYAYLYTKLDQLLYRTSYIYNRNKYSADMRSSDSVEIRYQNFVFDKQQPYGALYDENKDIANKKVRVDSMLKELWITHLGIFNGPMSFDTTLLYRKHRTGSDTTLEEAYVATLKRDTTFKAQATMWLWYIQPIQGSPFSFSRPLDSMRGRQVCRVYIDNRIDFVKDGKPVVAAFAQHYTLQEIPVTNAAELLPYFERQRRGEYAKQLAEVQK
jgi:hypothetical protein